MKQKKMYVAGLFAYATPSASEVDENGKSVAKGLFSVGMSIASRLNGNADFVGSFNPNKVNINTLWVGFVTFRKRFGDPVDHDDEERVAEAKAEALDFVKEQQRKYPVLSTLNTLEWEWGDELEGEVPPAGTEFRSIDFISPEERIVRAKAEKKELKFNGMVTEPVEA